MQFNEPEEMVNPLMDEPTIERSYTTPNVEASQQQLNTDIPEPTFQPPPISAEGNDTGAAGGKEKKKEEPKPAANPAMNDASDKDKEQGAEHVANLILDGWASLKEQANGLLVIPEKTLNKLQREGKIDLTLPMPYGMGQVAPAGEVIQAYNEDVKGTFSMSKEFRKEAKPALMRVLGKRGAGMTDEQFLLMLAGKEVAGMGFTIFHMKRTSNELMNGLVEMTAAYRGSGHVAHGTPVTPQAMSQTPPAAGGPAQQPQQPQTPPTAPVNDGGAEYADVISGENHGEAANEVKQHSPGDTISQHMEEIYRGKEQRHHAGPQQSGRVKGPRVPKLPTSGGPGRRKSKDYIKAAAAGE